MPQHTATRCNPLQNSATRCNTLQHTATHTRRPSFALALSDILAHSRRNALQHAATRCDTLQHAATRCNTLQHAATCCNTLQQTATLHIHRLPSRSKTFSPIHATTHCNTLQHTATLTRCTTTHTRHPSFALALQDILAHSRPEIAARLSTPPPSALWAPQRVSISIHMHIYMYIYMYIYIYVYI